MPSKPKKDHAKPAGNALAAAALESIKKIEQEAEQKKLSQLDSLKAAREEIQKRIAEFQHQLAQIDKVFGVVNGPPREARTRRNLDDVRERMLNWLTAHRGQSFMAKELGKEFPEAADTSPSIILKPMTADGRIKVDASEGVRRSKYYVE